MEYTELGRTGEKIPRIGIGTWKMLNGYTDIEAIRVGTEHGMNLVDTAEMYGNEAMVGEAIKGIDNIFVATKVSPHNFKYDDVIRSCNASLGKLGVKQIDLYQLHWPNHSVPIAETMRAMEQLKKDGKIRHIGVSNFDVKELEEAQHSLKNDEIVSNQVEYSILVRDVEKKILSHCMKNKITVIAYSPLARGAIFSRKYDNLRVTLTSIGENHDKSAAQVALNWLVSRENVIAIPKAGDKGHAIENAEAVGWNLTKEEMSEINSFLSRVKKRSMTWVFTPVIKRSGFWSRRMAPKERAKP
jgi:diketogulonate reductase-like aldo/keto reductase